MNEDRYEILDTIAKGEFATVSRARDRDLGREVAVKQIHAQYLAEPKQLARYWQEAQLLASLQHANILTIYDVVRPRGWLILELMRGSLKPYAEGGPMDLDQLRAVLIHCLSGLAFLHSNKVIHGDIKPSNILVGPPNRVKLGDFGLARRASNEEGSLLKGTTKYMAPELLSAQFGTVGPASDLYSLGITAYELLVGRQFESLLPTLATFGRDKQLAWMMWHSTADVKLPEVQRVLEGVPDDLARVIQRLIAKDQSQRYASAAEALRDLQTGRPVADGLIDAAVAEAEAATAEAARRKKRMRTLSIFCGGAAVVLCALIALAVLSRKPKPPPVQTAKTIHGTISDVFPMSKELGVVAQEGGGARRIKIRDQDVILVNGKSHLFEELEPNDEVEITEGIDPASHKDNREIRATRHATIATGTLFARDDAKRIVEVKTDEDPPRQMTFFIPPELKAISLNGLQAFRGRPVAFSMLRPGDSLTVQYDYQTNTGNVANKLKARRRVELHGIVSEDCKGDSLTVIDENQQTVTLAFAPQCVILVNGKRFTQHAELKRGDRVAIKHETDITEVVAQRTLGAEGVVEQVRFDPPLSLSMTGQGGQKATYSVGADCKITLGGEVVPFDVLRAGDRAAIEHGALDPKGQKLIAATSIAAERPTDPARWALLIAVQNYDDTKLSKLDYPLADAAALAETMSKRYRVPADNLRVFNDPSAVTLERELPEFLKLVPAEARLIVYFVGHACKDDKGQVYLAPKDFRSDKPEVNGRALQWLVDLLEECPAKEKLLLLDGSHAGSGAEQPREPSSAEMIGSLKRRPNRALLLTVTAVASCQKGQREIEPAGKQHGLFAECLADGYGGAADFNHNTRVEPTELFAYLKKSMAAAGQGKQTPEIFSPNNAPPRLSEAAKAAIRHLADFAVRAKIDPDEVEQDYAAAVKASGNEPEPRLIYGLLLMKHKDIEGREKAIQHFQAVKSDFQSVKSEMPERLLLLPYAALAWLRMEKRSYATAMNDLAAMMAKAPKLGAGETSYEDEVKDLFIWSGRLRELAAGVAESSRPLNDALTAVDAAVSTHGPQAIELYAQGRQATAKVLADFDARMAESKDDVEIKKLQIDRRQLYRYAEFPLDKYVQAVRQQMDQ
jgi:tRNA A-37 threonylcarbamoyl transferase component Bud32